MKASSYVTSALLLPIVALISACHLDTRPAVGAYRGHRILVWTVDKETGKLQGFAEELAPTGTTVSVESVRGYEMVLTLGSVGTTTYRDSTHEWPEPTVPVKLTHDGSSEGTMDLKSPRVEMEWGAREKLQSVVVFVPVGSLESPAVARVLAGPNKRDLGELEDVLLAMVQDRQIELGDLMEVYSILRRTERQGQWVSLLKGKDADAAELAAGVCTLLGDPDATARFCDLCVTAKSNEQIELIEALCMMPASDRALATLLKLIAAPGEYLLTMPKGMFASDADRRFGMEGAVQEKYPKAQVLAAARELVNGTAPIERPGVEKRLEQELKP